MALAPLEGVLVDTVDTCCSISGMEGGGGGVTLTPV